uniref:Uncharacterized protein n=1 Tax=Mimivirus LCMiAC02 TaxID=2506609 RepID=A0A481Z108_9VIRU|nr:MAG: hypothetical protein LCMiAC02_02520 [Mimivirus LCMiAC02]
MEEKKKEIHISSEIQIDYNKVEKYIEYRVNRIYLNRIRNIDIFNKNYKNVIEKKTNSGEK